MLLKMEQSRLLNLFQFQVKVFLIKFIAITVLMELVNISLFKKLQRKESMLEISDITQFQTAWLKTNTTITARQLSLTETVRLEKLRRWFVLIHPSTNWSLLIISHWLLKTILLPKVFHADFSRVLSWTIKLSTWSRVLWVSHSVSRSLVNTLHLLLVLVQSHLWTYLPTLLD